MIKEAQGTTVLSDGARYSNVEDGTSREGYAEASLVLHLAIHPEIRSLRSCFWIGLQRMLGGTGLVSTAFHSSKPLWSGVHRDTYEKLAVAKE
ncbi:hypothetical protein Tco_1541213 [Tanacetum coccineum]